MARRFETLICLPIPQIQPIASTTVHNATQIRSTDPKNSGANTSVATVAQSCTNLNDCTGAPIAASISPRRLEISSSSLPSGFCRSVDCSHSVGRIRNSVRRVADECKQLVVIHDASVSYVHHILCSYLETGGQQHSRRISKVDVVDGRDPVVGEPLGIDAHLLQ